jgi:hypothetical protein
MIRQPQCLALFLPQLLSLASPAPVAVPIPAPVSVPSPAPVAGHTPTPVPTPPQPPTITFDNNTGPQGRRRRKQTRRHTTKPKHTHDTRANRRAPAITAALEVAPEQHFTLHDNAFNPDTGTIAEYPKLSRCSEGRLWQQ